MELEEMKSIWGELSGKVENQEKIKKEELMKMTRVRYKKKIGKIALAEVLGSVICFAFAIYWIVKFPDLENPVNQVMMIFNILLVIILPVFSLKSIWQLNQLDLGISHPSEVVNKFIRDEKRFWIVQKAGLFLSCILLITILPPLAELGGNPSVMTEPWFWWAYVLFGFLFFVFFTRMVIGHYKGTLKKSEDILRELD